MKNIIPFVLLIFLFVSCKKEEIIPEDSVKISGVIARKGSVDEIKIIGRNQNEVLKVNPDGSFEKTFKLKSKGYFTFYDGKNKIPMYLSGANNIFLVYDYLDPDKLFDIKGKGYETTNFIHQRNKFEKKPIFRNTNRLLSLSEEEFNKNLDELQSEINKLLSAKGVDSIVFNRTKQNYERHFNSLKKRYLQKQYPVKIVKQGEMSPDFNFINYKGGRTSLKDLRGNYVYIDVWATWCGPCKQQIPYLKKIEKELKNKPVKFVSISVDDARRNGGSQKRAEEKWRKFVKDNNLGGIQLFSDNGWDVPFIKQYGIRGIPRFILLDKEGKILDINAPRPSNPSLLNRLKNLK